jgi:hypothetical protein
MDEKNEGSTTVSEGSQSTAENKQPDVNELVERLTKLEQTNKRLLEESNDYKKKYKLANSEVEEKEKKIALEKGDLQKLLDMERKEKARIADESQGLKKTVIKKQLELAINKYAQDANNVDDFYNQPAFAHILKEAIDEESLTLNEEKVQLYVSEVFKAKPHYKKSINQPNTVSKKPIQQVNGVKSIDKMDAKEIEEILRAKFS